MHKGNIVPPPADRADILIRAQTRDQDEAFRQAFQESFENEVGDHYMTWKYWENPWGTNLNYVALNNGNIIGALGCLLKDLRVENKVVSAAQEMDMFVVKEFRKSGTYFKLFRFRAVETSKSGAAFSFGVTSAFLRDLTVRLFKFSDVCEIPHLCKIITPHLVIDRKLGNGVFSRSLGITCDLAAGGYDRVIGAGTLGSSRFEISEIDAFGSEYDAFWEAAAEGLGIAVVRDSKYMNWRYNQNPDTRFTKLALRRDGKLCSVIVFTEIEQENRKALVMEFLLLPGEEKSGMMLLSEAVRTWKNNSVETAWCWMLSGVPGYRLLRRIGFFPRLKELYLQVRNVTGDIPLSLLIDPREWYLTLGDTDFFYGRQI